MERSQLRSGISIQTVLPHWGKPSSDLGEIKLKGAALGARSFQFLEKQKVLGSCSQGPFFWKQIVPVSFDPDSHTLIYDIDQTIDPAEGSVHLAFGNTLRATSGLTNIREVTTLVMTRYARPVSTG